MQKTLNLSSRLAGLPDTAIVIDPAGHQDEAAEKKHARLQVSLRHTSPNLGFLHAALVKYQEFYFLLAGPSGVGKSTYADLTGCQVLANDWVAVEKDGDNFFASDLNFRDKLVHPERCKLAGVIFLVDTDALGRDAFVPNPSELDDLLGLTYDTAEAGEKASLRNFWSANAAALPGIVAVPTRRHNLEYVADTIKLIFRAVTSPYKNIEVGVVGIGAVGAELASSLGKLPFVSGVHMYDHTFKKAKGYALDMSQALPNGKAAVYHAHETAEALFAASSVVFFTFRRNAESIPDNKIPERWQKHSVHTAIIQELVDAANAVKFEGTVFVISNPVDYLTYQYYALSQNAGRSARSFQVYGVGLDLDVARAVFYANKAGYGIRREDIDVFGNHADEFVMESSARLDMSGLLNEVKGASKEVRDNGVRTVYAPVAAAIRSVHAYAEGGTIALTLIQEGAYMGRKVTFAKGLPMLPAGKLPAEYNEILLKNKQQLAN